MASKLATEPTQSKTLYLVDSESETARSELETSCRDLIFSFIEMKDSHSSICADRQSLLHPSKRSVVSPDRARGTTLAASSATDIASEGSSVDLVESSVDLLAMDNVTHISGDEESALSLVPVELPAELRDNMSQVDLEDLKKLYNIEACAEKLEKKELTTIELIVLHLRSYRNISRYEDMEALRIRFVGFFGSIFADLIAVCYPNRGERNVVSGVFTRKYITGVVMLYTHTALG